MTDSKKQFVAKLAETNLLSAEEMRKVTSLAEESGTLGAREFSETLVRRQTLTEYQAEAIYNDEHHRLAFGEYVILDKIGEGGMGVVLSARHRSMDRTVAIKILPPEALAHADAIPRFRKEVRAAAKLTHSNIVSAYDAGEHSGMHFLVMEHVDGEDLSRLVRNHGPLPEPQVIEIAIQAATGLDYAHKKGLIHRDIKPQNLLVDQAGIVKVLDMGLVRFEQEQINEDSLTKSNQIMGTVDYMSPEQAVDMKRVDARSDVYSLGCTLFFLLTGKPPYYEKGQTLMERLLAHRESETPLASDFAEDVSPALDILVQTMMSKTPEERFQSMEEVIEALPSIGAAIEECHQETVTLARDDLTVAKPTVTKPRPGRNRVALAGTGAALLVAIVGSLAFWSASNPADTNSNSNANANTDTSAKEIAAEADKQDAPQRGGPLQWKSGRANLLSSIHLHRDVSRQSGKGKVRFIENTLIVPPNAQVMLRYPFPEFYRLELVVERKPPVDEALMLIMKGPESLFGLVIGKPNGSGRFESGIQPFGTTRFLSNPESVVDGPVIVSEQRLRIHVSVERGGITVTVDDQVVLNWQKGFGDFKTPQQIVKSLVFTSNHSEFCFHAAEVVDLTTPPE